MTTYEQAGRAVKAGKFAEILRAANITSSEVQRNMTDAIWRELAFAHELKPPSPETVAAIIGLMEAQERASL